MAPPFPDDVVHAPIPFDWARRHGILRRGDTLWLRQGFDRAALLPLSAHLGSDFALHDVSAADFDAALAQDYGLTGDGGWTGMAASLDNLDHIARDVPSAEDVLGSADDAPAIRLINAIIADALRHGASDIHIEPFASALVIRRRTDGILTEALRLPAKVAPVLVSRIKVMARLDIAERRLPQDGRISLQLGGRVIDARVATLPGHAGERVVLRLLDTSQTALDLVALGLDGAAASLLHGALSEPNGICLITGPTGSGKTTSLYAALAQLNDGSRNILTIEDPIEYAIEGIGQTQVNARVGLDFAGGLRAILRQDPDVVLVGEIRDRETAEVAVQASLTGHLVLASVHTNDAVGAVTRLIDLGVEPFLIAASLRAVVAQRLVRRLCPQCRQSVPAAAEMGEALGIAPDTPVWRAIGCTHCGESGFAGRVGIFEAVRVDDALRTMIHKGADEAEMAAHAFADGRGMTLAAAARAAVLDGTTNVAEAVRITRSGGGDG